MSYKRELYLLHKNRSSSGISIAGIGGSDEKHNFTVHMADTNKKLWDISYKKSAGFGGDIIEVKPCTDTLKDYEYTIYIEKVGVTFKARVQKENEVIATMAENLESINNRDYGDKYDKSFDIEAGDKDLQFSLRRSVPYSEHEFLTQNKKDYRKPFATITYGASDVAYLSEFYQNDRKRGYYIATEEDDFELYVAYAVIYEVWSLRETKGQNMTLSSVISESDTLTGTNDLSKLANGLKGRFKKFLK